MTSVQTARLGEIAKFIRGINFKPDDVVATGTPGTVACLRTKNVQDQVDLSDVWAVPESAVRRDEQYLQEGDILISSANSWNLVGKCCWIPALPWRTSLGGFVSGLRASPERLDPRFLYRWFSSDPIQATLRSFGQKTTNISNFNIGRCQQLEIPLPPLPEQRRIAAILDQAEALRTQRRTALALLDTLTQSIFLDMFGDPVTNPKGWPVSTVGAIAAVQGGLQVTTARKDLPLIAPYLRVANVYRKYLDLSEIKTIRATAVEVARTMLSKDDLLIVEGHGNPNEIGRSALWTGEITGCIHQNHIIRARLDGRKVVPIYACEYLNSQGGRQHLMRTGKTTTGLNTISVSNVRESPIALPPLLLQQTFATRISAIEALKSTHRAALAQLDALFASLQHRAFSGELTRPGTAAVQTLPTAARSFNDMLQLDPEKGLEALVYVGKRTPKQDLYKALKTVYLADRHHLEHHGCFIYGETYNALPMGPVPQAAYEATKRLNQRVMFSPFDDDQLHAALRCTGDKLIALREADFSKLSEAERKSLDRAISYFADMSFEQVKTASHDSAYDKTPANAPIAMQDLIASLPQKAQQQFFGGHN